MAFLKIWRSPSNDLITIPFKPDRVSKSAETGQKQDSSDCMNSHEFCENLNSKIQPGNLARATNQKNNNFGRMHRKAVCMDWVTVQSDLRSQSQIMAKSQKLLGVPSSKRMAHPLIRPRFKQLNLSIDPEKDPENRLMLETTVSIH